MSAAELSNWSMQEESRKLAQELVRLGRPLEPMSWSSEEVENKWLRREATYELFKALADCTSTQEPAMELTRNPMPVQSDDWSPGALQHQSVSRLIRGGKDSF